MLGSDICEVPRGNAVQVSGRSDPDLAGADCYDCGTGDMWRKNGEFCLGGG